MAESYQPGVSVSVVARRHDLNTNQLFTWHRQFRELAGDAGNKRRGKRAAPISPVALEAVTRIDALFDIERGINGEPALHRLAVRRELSAPLLVELECCSAPNSDPAGSSYLNALPRRSASDLSADQHSTVVHAMDVMLGMAIGLE